MGTDSRLRKNSLIDRKNHMKQTLTKAQLLDLLATVPDESKIYVHTRTESADAAIATANQGWGDELFFRLSGDLVPEADGVSVVVDFAWRK